ncbi:hypothetical protein [Bacillus gaemokensis]|uniref:hypothetical protein n=1 Tax=Bacillus gaemokensis TaxID=574375 RepID=UPI000A86D64A|nr:hypothetical protein [Bacillus gaemokensis]
MYMLDDVRDSYIKRLLELWDKDNMLVFTKEANDMYENYGETTADEVMLMFKNKLQNR